MYEQNSMEILPDPNGTSKKISDLLGSQKLIGAVVFLFFLALLGTYY